MDIKNLEKDNSITMHIKYLKGIGELRARWFKNLGVTKVIDLMEFFPTNYIYRQINPSNVDLMVGERITLTVNVNWVEIRTTAKKRQQLNVGVNDGKSQLICTWFTYPKHYEKLFKVGMTIWINGVLSDYNHQLQIIHPEFEVLDAEQLDKERISPDSDFWKQRSVLPVYRLSGNLTQGVVRKAVFNAFAGYADLLDETLPKFILSKYKFPSRKEALQKMHFTLHPDQIETIRKRFAYEEFLYLQLMWARHNVNHRNQVKGICFENKKVLVSKLYKRLPFKLTDAQIKVIKELYTDMTSARQMSRLLQGDVGSGKTIVVVFTMLLAVENGYQAVIMAPTEILAEQHYRNISDLLDPLGINVCILKGGSYKGKNQTKDDISTGKAQIIIGTHALIQDDIVFYKLGFAAVDEQHRFGVEQRALLARKDFHPDLLYLSATPIPRSLAMTVYGDLEVSVLDELPPNRKQVQTLIRSNSKIELVYSEIRKELKKGRQLYIVCPLIEESDKIDLMDAERLFVHISTKVYPEYVTRLLHGRMKAIEKDEIMRSFKAGEINILVSTTVIEVGVDVPNASVILIEHAERFGLSQLHQLRGRVGRGGDQSWCYLIEHFPISAVGRERLATLAGSSDGFVIAEKDLELRGPGECFGTEQSGLPNFRYANLLRDQEILKQARSDAFDIIKEDPELSQPQHLLIKHEFERLYLIKECLIQY